MGGEARSEPTDRVGPIQRVYRPEIDGLRAFAVAAVILFHAGLPGFAGGFVGVDIFFVISGFLITKIITSDLDRGSFSVIAFYERRIRRLLPALFIVMIVSTILGFWWMLPDDLENFGQSLVATSLFANNILLLFTSNYWSQAAEFKPLLHTWTLGVEEQFYLIYPFALIMVWRLPARYRSRALMIAMGISVVIALGLTLRARQIAFYALPSRAWELLLGALVARWEQDHGPAEPDAPRTTWLSIAGLALITGAVLLPIRHHAALMSATVVAAAGAAIVLRYAVIGTATQRLLARPIAVGIGLVSYGAYLWHFPLFAFARLYSVTRPGLPVMLILALAAFCLAALSWRFLERPLRDQSRFGRRIIFAGALVVSTVLIAIGTVFNVTNGLPSRLSRDQLVVGRNATIAYNERIKKLSRERFTSSNTVKLLVVGNSFARDFANMVLEIFDRRGMELIYRDDLPQCIQHAREKSDIRLFETADIIVFAHTSIDPRCLNRNIQISNQRDQHLFYAGLKRFGFNINWLMRLPADQRANRFNPVPLTDLQAEAANQRLAARHYISLIGPIRVGNSIQITDEKGLLLSADRVHVTRDGARLLGRKALLEGRFGQVVRERRAKAGRMKAAEQQSMLRCSFRV